MSNFKNYLLPPLCLAAYCLTKQPYPLTNPLLISYYFRYLIRVFFFCLTYFISFSISICVYDCNGCICASVFFSFVSTSVCSCATPCFDILYCTRIFHVTSDSNMSPFLCFTSFWNGCEIKRNTRMFFFSGLCWIVGVAIVSEWEMKRNMVINKCCRCCCFLSSEKRVRKEKRNRIN